VVRDVRARVPVGDLDRRRPSPHAARRGRLVGGRARARARRRARDADPPAPSPARRPVFGAPARERRGLGAGGSPRNGGERANGPVPAPLPSDVPSRARPGRCRTRRTRARGVLRGLRDDTLAASLGIVLCGTTARYQTVGTDEPHRRRGLASHLLGVAARWAADRGCDRWVIVTASTNPAGRIYRAVGFEPVPSTVQAYRRYR
jgi:GNAT superfamily N-acetyltransferase